MGRGRVDPAGPLEPVSDEPWGEVARVPLRGGGWAWFKACEPARAFEVPLTTALAGRWPDRLPGVLAGDEERGWLLLADAGERVGLDADIALWLEALPRYAELQRGETAHVDEHLAKGVPDRRLARFPELYERLLAAEPRIERRPELAPLWEELAAAGIPATIQHDDLHGHNVYAERGLRFLDWGDACISHPFLTFFVTVAHLGNPPEERLRDAYLEPWGGAELRETFAVARRLGPYAHAFKELETLGVVPDWVLPLL